MAKNTIRNAYGTYTICAQSSGSYRWFAVREGYEAHPINALWLALTVERLAEMAAQGIHSDGCARFFATKRELVAALNGTTVKAA